MFRPTPGIFLGSTQHDGLCADGFADAVVTCSSAAALLGASAVWIGAYLVDGHADPLFVFKLSCCAMLAPSLAGLWLARRAAQEPRRVITRIYAIASSRLAQPERLAVRHATEDVIGGLGGLLGHLARRAGRLNRSEQTALVVRQGLSDSRAEAAKLTAELGAEAVCLTDAAAQVDATAACLAREMAANAGPIALSDMALGRAADATDRIADRVRATTACAEQMASIAIQLSDTAHGAHKAVAGQDDKSTKLNEALDQIEQVMQAAVRLLSEAMQDGADLPADSASARRACEMQLAAGRCQPALAAAQAVMRDLVSETAAASRRTIELSELIAKQYELGQAVGHAVQQQAADIGAVLNDLYEARSGFAVLRDSVDAVTRLSAQRADTAVQVRGAALRLPSRAERLADILRGIPDFGPAADI